MRTENSKMRKFYPRSETCKNFTAQLPAVRKLQAFKVGKRNVIIFGILIVETQIFHNLFRYWNYIKWLSRTDLPNTRGARAGDPKMDSNLAQIWLKIPIIGDYELNICDIKTQRPPNMLKTCLQARNHVPDRLVILSRDNFDSFCEILEHLEQFWHLEQCRISKK